jgi:hypothetical protein
LINAGYTPREIADMVKLPKSLESHFGARECNMDPIHIYASLLVTTFVAILGWLIAHYFATGRDVVNKCREMRTAFLLDAYRRLESAARRDPTDETRAAIVDYILSSVDPRMNLDVVIAAAKAVEGSQRERLLAVALEYVRQNATINGGDHGLRD